MGSIHLLLIYNLLLLALDNRHRETTHLILIYEQLPNYIIDMYQLYQLRSQNIEGHLLLSRPNKSEATNSSTVSSQLAGPGQATTGRGPVPRPPPRPHLRTK